MTALALALKSGAPRLKAFVRFFTDIFAGLGEGQEIARRYEELSRLSDEALAARGVTREELPQAIVTGRICH
ncbi:MAG: hypothetical protein WD871_15995 [Xanthobacteraceae bacterium]